MRDSQTDPVRELNRLVTDGIYTDIYLALEAHHIFRSIGERVPSANASTYQSMLVALQAYASAEFVLAATRLLERQRRAYELHSVHGVLTFLGDHAHDIPVQEAVWIQQSMERLKMWDQVAHMREAEQTRAVVEILVSKLPHHTTSTALKALKALRDKRIAHPEKSTPEGFVTTSWKNALELLEIPVEALSICGAYTAWLTWTSADER